MQANHGLMSRSSLLERGAFIVTAFILCTMGVSCHWVPPPPPVKRNTTTTPSPTQAQIRGALKKLPLCVTTQFINLETNDQHQGTQFVLYSWDDPQNVGKDLCMQAYQKAGWQLSHVISETISSGWYEPTVVYCFSLINHGNGLLTHVTLSFTEEVKHTVNSFVLLAIRAEDERSNQERCWHFWEEFPKDGPFIELTVIPKEP